MANELKLSQISVVMLGVKDVKRSIEFYRDKLGLVLQNQFEVFAFFQAGGVTLVLTQALLRGGPVVVGTQEIVFGVEGVRETHDALIARGVAFTQDPRVVNPPMWAANFNDPDGHHLSIYGPERKA
ncbi:MAG: VOC family protein [Acidobacteria bacterium]|nr:VOC family protein [Acidobacteriota bacterium]